MCSGHDDSQQAELQAARQAAQKAQARANLALTAATKAKAQAQKASRPVVDQEKAQRAAEAEMRKRVTEGTYTRTFLGGTGLPPPSIGYRMLTGA